jgi:hypothetical protein
MDMNFALIDDPDPRDGGCTDHERHRHRPKTFLEEPFDRQLPLQLSGFRLVLARAGKMTLWQQQSWVCF